MARRTFRLIKDSVEVKKGAIVQEKCDDGDQQYVVLDIKSVYKFEDNEVYFGHNPELEFSRDTVEKQPDWFEEVFAPDQVWLTAEERNQGFAFRTAKKYETATKKVVTPKSKRLGNQTKYPWIHTMEVGAVKQISTASRGRVNAATWNYSKSSGKQFAFKKLNNYSTEVTRVK